MQNLLLRVALNVFSVLLVRGCGEHSVGAHSIFVQFAPRSCSQVFIRFNVVEHFAGPVEILLPKMD